MTHVLDHNKSEYYCAKAWNFWFALCYCSEKIKDLKVKWRELTNQPENLLVEEVDLNSNKYSTLMEFKSTDKCCITWKEWQC